MGWLEGLHLASTLQPKSTMRPDPRHSPYVPSQRSAMPPHQLLRIIYLGSLFSVATVVALSGNLSSAAGPPTFPRPIVATSESSAR